MGGALGEGTPEEQTAWMSHRDSVTGAARGGRGHGLVRVDADRGVRGARARPLRRPVPPRGRAHAARAGRPEELPLRRRRSRPAWTPAAVIEEQVERIRAQVGRERVLCALSGGVDSAVAALLVHKAVGDQLTCVFVDHGLLRKDEAAQVVETFEGHFHVPLVHVDAEERFLARLEGVTDPEEKRRIVGEEFIRVFEEEASRLGDAPLPRPGHALLGRDRVGRHRGRRRQDQVASQRRRPPRRHDDGAGRAAALAVQGRGAARGGGARPAGADGLAAPVPGSRARDPDHRRGHREQLEILREADAILLEEIAGPGSTASCGSASPSCPRSARSASRATSAPTATRS